MTVIPKQTDVVVIGGGPSGSLSAGLMSTAGIDVVLLEKASHPRPMVGESLLPHFWRFTDMLGASKRIEEAGFVEKAGVIASWNGTMRRTRFKEFGHRRPALHVDRGAFDKILLDSSRDRGTSVFERTTVTAVEVQDRQRMTVRFRKEDGETGQIEAKHVVDASGQSAVVARQFGFREFDEALKFSALWGYYRGGSYLDYDGEIHDVAVRFESPPVTYLESIGGWGWTWQIVLRDSVSVGVILPPDKLREFKAKDDSLDGKFASVVRETPGLATLMAGAEFIRGSVKAIRDYAYKPVKLAVDGCYLVGDAAAFVDPINSSGVTFGMYAAVLAAWSIERSLKQPTRAQHFEDFFQHQYLQRLHIFRLVAVPPDRDFNGAELDELSEAFKCFSRPEQQLALTTTILTNRPDRTRHLFQQLGIPESAVYNEIPVPAAFG